jgi:hypothetical protein
MSRGEAVKFCQTNSGATRPANEVLFNGPPVLYTIQGLCDETAREI